MLKRLDRPARSVASLSGLVFIDSEFKFLQGSLLTNCIASPFVPDVSLKELLDFTDRSRTLLNLLAVGIPSTKKTCDESVRKVRGMHSLTHDAVEKFVTNCGLVHLVKVDVDFNLTCGVPTDNETSGVLELLCCSLCIYVFLAKDIAVLVSPAFSLEFLNEHLATLSESSLGVSLLLEPFLELC